MPGVAEKEISMRERLSLLVLAGFMNGWGRAGAAGFALVPGQ